MLWFGLRKENEKLREEVTSLKAALNELLEEFDARVAEKVDESMTNDEEGCNTIANFVESYLEQNLEDAVSEIIDGLDLTVQVGSYRRRR